MGGGGLRVRQPGGIRSLARLLEQRWEAVEADFQRFYGLDLSRADEIGLRRIHVLVRQLPPESSLARALYPDAWWGIDKELLAQLLERVDQLGRMFHSAWLKGAPPRPLRVPRPWKRTPTGARPAGVEFLRSLGPVVHIPKEPGQVPPGAPERPPGSPSPDQA